MRSFGLKKPQHTKNKREEDIENNRYYFTDKIGNHDEWASIHRNLYESATHLQKVMDKNKRDLMVNEYGQGEYQKKLDRVQEVNNE